MQVARYILQNNKISLLKFFFSIVDLLSTLRWWSNGKMYVDQLHMHTGYKEFDSSFEVQNCLDKKRLELHMQGNQAGNIKQTIKHIFRDKSIWGSDFTHLRVHRVTFNSGAWRERWSNSEDQQKEPVGWLNKFQHTGEKTTEKATFKFHWTASLNHPIYTSLARQWRGPSVCQRGDAAAQNCPSSHTAVYW